MAAPQLTTKQAAVKAAPGSIITISLTADPKKPLVAVPEQPGGIPLGLHVPVPSLASLVAPGGAKVTGGNPMAMVGGLIKIGAQPVKPKELLPVIPMPKLPQVPLPAGGTLASLLAPKGGPKVAVGSPMAMVTVGTQHVPTSFPVVGKTIGDIKARDSEAQKVTAKPKATVEGDGPPYGTYGEAAPDGPGSDMIDFFDDNSYQG